MKEYLAESIYTCPNCGTDYPLYYDPDLNAYICEECGLGWDKESLT